MSDQTPIWQKPVDAAEMTARMAATLCGLLGIRILAFGPDWVSAEMPVDARHIQPAGILHGGASVVLAETLGSMACYLAVPEGKGCVGLEVNANHIAAVPLGQTVTAICRALHVGRTTQVWQTEIRRADGRLACVSRLTCAVIDAMRPGGGS
jgi:1,4-dihydroxy-2-naphthoyl-CoA hydrolase